MAKKPKKKPPPKCKAILLCDQILIDSLTGKLSIIGIFENFFVTAFPAATAPFTAFLQMTDGVGQYNVTVEVYDLQEDAILGAAQGPVIDFAERTVKLNFFIPVPPLPLTHLGRYDFIVMADGQEIDRQQFEAINPGVPPDADDQSPD